MISSLSKRLLRFHQAALHLLSAVTFVSMASCVGPNDDGPRSSKEIEQETKMLTTQSSLRKKVCPGQNNRIALTTLPTAKCSVTGNLADLNDPQSAKIDFYSDTSGEISFWYQPDKSTATIPMQLYCADEQGNTLSQAIEFEPSAVLAVDDLGTPKGLPRKPLGSAQGTLTSGELVANGFPPQPDPNLFPGAYQKWLSIVQSPAVLVPPRLVKTNRRADIITENWSGYGVFQNAPYYAVTGDWVIPNVEGENLIKDYASIWVGIGAGNANSGTLWQAGTEQEVFKFLGANIRTLSPWIELPVIQGQISISGMNMAIGHRIFVEVWIGDSNGNVNLQGGYAWWYIADATNGAVSMDKEPIPANLVVNGGSAEWIVERSDIVPNCLNCSHLARFSSFTMTGANAYTLINFNIDPAYQTQNPIRYQMHDTFDPNSRLLAAANYGPSTREIAFSWGAFH